MRRFSTSCLSSFMFGDAVHEQATRTVRPFEDGDGMAGRC